MDGLYKKAGSTFFLKVFGLGIAFIFQIILGRLLEPASYGEYTMYLTYSSIFTIITVFGMDQNLIKEIAKNNNDKKRSNSLLQLSMIISIMLCFLVSVTVFFFKDKLDFGADGVKEAQYEPQNEFRNTSGFTYREKMEKDLAGVLSALGHYHLGSVRAGDCRCPGGTGRGSPGNHRGQLYRGA